MTERLGMRTVHKGKDPYKQPKTKDPKKDHNLSQSQQQDKHKQKGSILQAVDVQPLACSIVPSQIITEMDEKNTDKSFSKREIRSNWRNYELPVDNYEIIEAKTEGEDFTKLLSMPVSRGGHFQFKHEKTWTTDKKSSQYSDLFTFNFNYISSALSCIPFYDRIRLDPSLFSTEQSNRMSDTASKNLAKFKRNLPIEKEEEIIARSHLKLIYPSETKSDCKEDLMNSDFQDDINLNDFNQEVLETVVKHEEPLKSREDITNQTANAVVDVKKTEHPNIESDDELDEILGLGNTEPMIITVNSPVKSAPEIISSPEKSSNTTVPDSLDLDKWLDEYLES